MSISFSCEECGKPFAVDDAMAGKKCRCTQCGHVFPIPRAGSASGSSVRPARPAQTGPHPVPRRAVPEARLDDDEVLPPRGAAAGPKAGAKGKAKAKVARGGVPVPLIVVGVLGGLFVLVMVLAALLIPAVKAARQAAERARLKAEAHARAGRPMPRPTPPAIPGTPAPAQSPAPTGPFVPDPEEDDAYHANERFLADALNRFNEMGSLLATVNDQRSAQRVASRIQAIAEEVSHYEERAKALPAITPEQDEKLKQKYEGPIQASVDRMNREATRIKSIAGLSRFFNPPGAGVGRPSLASARLRVRTRAGMAPRAPVGSRPSVALAPMDPNSSITVNVSGADDKDTQEFVGQRIMEIIRGLSRSSRTRSHSSGGTMVYELSPVSDPKVFAERIDFGQVTRIEGRTIDVVARPARPGEVRPPDTDFVGQALYDLKSPAANRRQDAVRRLARRPAGERRDEVARAVEPMLKDPEGSTRADALKVLRTWGGPENVPAIVVALKDPDGFVKRAAFDALRELKDPRSAEPVAEFLDSGERRTAAGVLKAIGPEAEPAVAKYLRHGDEAVRREAAEVLKVIGSEKSVPDLRNLAMRNTGSDSRAAQDALKEMSLRGVDMNVAKRKRR